MRDPSPLIDDCGGAEQGEPSQGEGAAALEQPHSAQGKGRAITGGCRLVAAIPTFADGGIKAACASEDGGKHLPCIRSPIQP